MQVRLPNNDLANFPDDMSHAEVEAVLQKQFPTLPSVPPVNITQQDIDTINQQYPGMPQWLKKGLLNTSKYLVNNPDAVSNAIPVPEWMGTNTRAALRVPLEAAQKLGNLTESPFVKNSQWPSFIAEQPQDINHPIAELAGTIGGTLASGGALSAGMSALPIYGAAAAAAPSTFLGKLPFYAAEFPAIGAALSSPGQVKQNAVLGLATAPFGAAAVPLLKSLSTIPERISAARNLPKLEETGQQAAINYQNALASEKEAKDISQLQGSGSNLNKMKLQLPEQHMQLAQLGQQLADSKLSLPLNTEGAADGSDLIPNAKIHLQDANALQNDTDIAQSKKLYKGYENGVPIGEHVVQLEKGVEKSAENLYDQTEASLENENVVVPRSDQLNALQNEAKIYFEKSKPFMEPGTYDKLVNAYTTTNSKNIGNEIMPAVDVLRNYRTTHYLANTLRTKAYAPGTASDPVLQAQLFSQADAMDANAKNIAALLENQNLGSSLTTLKQANNIWHKQVIPVRQNSTYRTFLTKGYAPNKDIIYSLRGNGPGQAQMRNFITQSPEMSARALGMRYAKNADNLHNGKGSPFTYGDELDQPYLAALSPDTKAAINAHGQALQNTKDAESALENAHINAAKLNNYNDLLQQHQALRLQLTNTEHNIANLTAKSALKNISRQSKIDIDNQIQQAKQDSMSLKSQLKKMTAYIVGGYLANKLL